MDVRDLIKRHEGLKLKPYYDTVSKLTIGWGRNLTDVGISRKEAEILLDTDIATARLHASIFEWFDELDEVRQAVVIDMLFNLGPNKFRGFKGTIRALEGRAFTSAADRMLDSLWAKQVGKRAKRLAEMMRTGVFPPELA